MPESIIGGLPDIYQNDFSLIKHILSFVVHFQTAAECKGPEKNNLNSVAEGFGHT